MVIRYLEESVLIHNLGAQVRRVTMLSQWYKLQDIPNSVDESSVKKI